MLPLFTQSFILSTQSFVTQRLLTLLTDFGSRDAFVGIMKGVILGINPAVTLVDLSHEVPPQDILAGALILCSAVAFFPAGTIHVAVVDPGVGSNRRAILVETANAIFIGPDNGLLSLAAPADAVKRTVHLTNEHYFLPHRSQTFHGRDVFAPVAAHVSRGVSIDQLGNPTPTMTRLSLPPVERLTNGLVGSVIYVDHFGNVITNITEADLRPFPRETLLVSIDTVHTRGVVTSYAAVDIGAPAALINSWGMLEIAVRNGSAAQCFGIHTGQVVHISST
jgi:S-adenosylmethionine hydrolase